MTKTHSEPTWWLYDLPSAEEEIKLMQILGGAVYQFGRRQPRGNPHATFWPYVDVDKSVSEHKKLLAEILLSKKIVKDWINQY